MMPSRSNAFSPLFFLFCFFLVTVENLKRALTSVIQWGDGGSDVRCVCVCVCQSANDNTNAHF